METELHVVFGAGQVGYPLAERLLAASRRVRVVKLSPTHVPPGCERVVGDAAERAFCVDAASGATTVYHCMNPPYSARVWADFVPRYMDNLIAACSETGARLVVLDNLYMLGRPRGRPLDENTPMNPSSRKGEIRARAAERLFEAHRRGDILATSGRASDFYGPSGTQTAVGDFFWPRALSGKTVYLPFRLDALHTYHYIPDVAAALALLGCADASAYGQPWMLPCTPAGTLRQLLTRLEDKLGRKIIVAEVPPWIVKIAGVVAPLMRELGEMLYQWDEPFVVDDARFRQRFQAVPADVSEAALASVEWAKSHYRKALDHQNAT